MADAAYEKPAPVYGVDPSFADQIDSMEIDTDNVSEGAFSDIECTLIGMSQLPGGAFVEGQNGKEGFTQKDRISLSLRIDNAEEVGAEDPFTFQNIAQPKLIVKDGRQMRAAPTRGSAYDIWLRSFEAAGISAHERDAAVLRMTTMSDLIGVQFNRIIKRFGEGTNAFPVGICNGISGWDNEIRKAAGLPEIITAPPGSGSMYVKAGANPAPVPAGKKG